MPETIGNICLHLALVISVYSIFISIVGERRKKISLLESGRNALFCVAGLVFVSSASLVHCLMTGRFHLSYVYSYTNSTMPSFYKFAAFWGGQNGSLLFWLAILCVYSSIAVFRHRNKQDGLLPYVVVTLMTIASFFLIILIFAANPFDTMPFSQSDGQGLNPLLQNYYMIIHPPSLYLGYVGMSVPFAFAMSALVTRRLGNEWIKEVRIWTLVAWFFLSIGNLLGASWAYEVLGWGGYWAWDPVENAAFLPWLTSTAFLHSVIIQEKRNMLKTWNMVLVTLSFLMTMTGTFLTRSGIVSSVHSFAQSDIGNYFLCFLILCIVSTVYFVLTRLKELESQKTLDSYVSREAAFLFNNLIFVGSAFAILWGTLFPVLSEYVRGSKITVGPPYFNAIMIPIGLCLLLLTGIGPLVAWRKTSKEQLKKYFTLPIAACICVSIISYFLMPKPNNILSGIYANLSFSFSAFVLASIWMEYKEGIALRKNIFKENFATAFIRLIASNRRRYGGYIVHFGILLLFVGFAGNAFKTERELRIMPNQSVQIKEFTLKYTGLIPGKDRHKETVAAKVDVFRGSTLFASMLPSKVFFTPSIAGQEAQIGTDVAIKRSLLRDVYLALLSFDPDNRSIFVKAVINPLVQMIWIGGLFLILGSIIAMWPKRKVSA